MADLLRFRKGSLAQINAADAVAGTIYIAKDEKAMYVDVSNNKDERIRIGDFIRVNTINDIEFPYSPTALYYVETDNALVCYQEHVGEDGQKVGAWKQINSTAALRSAIETNSNDIANIKAILNDTENGNGEVTKKGLVTQVQELEAIVNDESTGTAANTAAITANAAAIESINETLNGKPASGEQEKVVGLIEKIETLEDTVGDATGGLVKDVNTLKDAIGMGDDGSVDGLAGTVLENSQKIEENTENIALNTQEITNTKATLTALTETLTDKYMLASDIEANYVKKTELDDNVNTLLNTKEYATTTYVDNAITAAGEKYASLDEYNQLSAIVSTLTGSDGAVADAQNAADEAKIAASNAQNTIDDYIEQHKEDYTDTEIDELVDGAKSIANTNADSIASINAKIARIEGSDGETGLIDTKVNEAKSELENKITDEINAANAMDYVGGVSKAEDLPATAKNGATYVAEEKFDLGVNQVYPGDLLIATGDEDEETGTITAPTWTIVKTGYDASLEQVLTGNNNAIVLSSPIGDSSSVEFASDGGAMKVEVTGNKASFGVYWEDFE